jgi:hypothetical protein
VCLLLLTADSWSYGFFSVWFWLAGILTAVAATLVYARRHPPQAQAASTRRRADSARRRVVALRCVINTLFVAALWHLVLAFNAHSDGLPFWLIVEPFAAFLLAIGWMGAPSTIEAIVLSQADRAGLLAGFRAGFKRFASEELILPAVNGVYLLCAGSAFVALILAVPRPPQWLPGWVILLGAWLGGGVFGFFMADAFVRLPRVKPLFEAAPINGATGVRLSIPDVFVPYTFIAFFGAILLPVFAAARHRAGLPSFPKPYGLIWVPVALALLMAAASLWAHLTRDPAEEERERAEGEASYRMAVAGNAERRAELIAGADLMLAAWERRERDGSGSWMPADIIDQVEAQLYGGGISYPLPDSDALMAAQSYLTSVLHAARVGASSVEGDRPPLLHFLLGRRTTVLSWDEALALVAEVATRLREERPMDDPRLLRFLGQQGVTPDKEVPPFTPR